MSQQPLKARSRLARAQKSRTAQVQQTSSARWTQYAGLIAAYGRYKLLAALSLGLYAVVWYILTTYYPDQIKSILLPNSFIVLQAPLFLANFFFFSFLFLHTRRGLLISASIALFVFLQLQHVSITPLQFLGWIGALALLELLLTGAHRATHR